MIRNRLVARLAVWVLLASTAQAQVDTTGLLVEHDVAVPMRDGTLLRADIYRPATDQPVPVLVYRTPYGKHDAARSYATHTAAVGRGYAVILQDVRGRYASAGHFEPYRNEGTDGFDTIEWAARQPWSNGRVGTFGLSYPGAVQWLAALESPPSLVAMAPAMTFSSPRNFVYMNGVFDLSWLPWIYINIAPGERERRDLPGIRTESEASATWDAVADDYLLHQPLTTLPYLRDVAPYYYEWLAHPPEDPWWDWMDVRGRYGATTAAVLNMSGWYDEAYGPEGAITNHGGLVAARGGAARSHLVLGPWKHGVHQTAQRMIGDLDFGPDAGIDYDALLLRFFDEYLKGDTTGLRDEEPVRYFETGTNAWRQAERWPPAGTTAENWCPAAGRLAACDGDGPASTLVADPADPVRDPYDSFGPHDYRSLAVRDDVLTFDSEVLDEDLTVAGNAVAHVFASCNCRDFDLWVRLQDVYPDGRAINLRSPGAEVIRASYRDPGEGHRLLEPGTVYEVTVGDVMLAHTFRAEHRIRLQVSASFAPHLSRNLQTGESEHFHRDAAVARITLHHSAPQRTTLVLPVMGAGPAR